MATRITVEIGQALLAQKAKAIAEQNREQRLERERQAKEQAQIKAAADKAAADRAKAGTEARAKAGTETNADKAKRKSGVPEYYTPPKVAAQNSNKQYKAAFVQMAAEANQPLGAPGTMRYVLRSLYAPEASLETTFTLPTYLGSYDNVSESTFSDDGTVIIRTNLVSGSQQSVLYYDDVMVLPAGGTSAVVIIHVLTITLQSSGSSYGEEHYTRYFPEIFDSGLDVISYPASELTGTGETRTSSRTTKAFLVHRDGVNEIASVPSEITTFYETNTPLPPMGTATAVGNSFCYNTDYSHLGIVSPDPAQLLTRTYPKHSSVGWVTTLPSLLRLHVGGRFPYAAQGPGNHLLRSYGMGYHKPPAEDYSGGPLVPYTGDPYAYSVTPSIFNIFGSAGHNKDETVVATYRDNYLEVSPDVFLDFETGEYSSTFPVEFNSPVIAGWKRNRSITLAGSAGDESTPPWDNSTDAGVYSPIMVWDWGKAAYCRQQLLGLGFTAEDLVP
jgi:hypothetical protein